MGLTAFFTLSAASPTIPLGHTLGVKATTPNVLVLGGGGLLGEAWMSAVLAGMAESGSFDPFKPDQYIGTSAGSIVAASLAAGIDPRMRLRLSPEPDGAPGRSPEAPRSRTGVSGLISRTAALGEAAASPLASLAISAAAPGGRLMRREVLARAPEGTRSLEMLRTQIDRLGATLDGRLVVSALDLQSGHRVMFGAPGAPAATAGEAVEASCSIPGYFRPAEIGGRRYVDGGVWSPTNMDTATVRRGSRVLCLNPTGSMRPGRRAVFGALGVVSRSAATVEAASLRRRGARAAVVSPDTASRLAMGPNLMDSVRHDAVVAAGMEQGRRAT